MWQIREHRDVAKIVRRLPPWIVKEYETWKDLVFRHGPEALRQFHGYHDEQLKGERKGQRSSRLSRQYRVIYVLDRNIVTVYVLEITPHHY
ncbi:MAG: addiction module toxin [Elusimicrobia bacterium RIFCSPLOWO2_01_FULL_59_12]|nr:MAG: addiction module toxin [Elusimicrobia bacterium RIFCSPLOWO2_01_FULL_59_12]